MRSATAMSPARPKIVIVGAGFGGLFAAQALAKVDADVTIVDRHNYHLFQPLLYQVATAGLPPSDIAWPIRSILRRQRNARVLLAEVEGVDVRGRAVVLHDRTIPFDYLVVATGSTHSYFGHEQWRALAPGLKSIDDATDPIIDDERANVRLLELVLGPMLDSRICAAHDGIRTRPRRCLSNFSPISSSLTGSCRKIDGCAVIESFRAPDGLRDDYLPIVVLTADITAHTRTRALNVGATDFLTKPFDHAEILLRIKNLLRARLSHLTVQAQKANL